MNEMAAWPTRPRQPEVCPFLLAPPAGLRPLDCFKRHPARSLLDRTLCQSLQPQEAGTHSHSTATLERGGEGSLTRFGEGNRTDHASVGPQGWEPRASPRHCDTCHSWMQRFSRTASLVVQWLRIALQRSRCGSDPWRACLLSHSVVSNSANPRALVRQAPLSMGFSRQEHWSGLPDPSPGELPDSGTELTSPAAPELQTFFHC